MSAKPLLALLAIGLSSSSLVPAQNCAGTSTGNVPLIDMGSSTYQGFEGGLYPGAANVPPPAHASAAIAQAQAIQPLDASGAPDAAGRIVLVSIGMSNTTQEFSTWVPRTNADPHRADAVVVVDGAQGGQDARIVADPHAAFWNNVTQRLGQNGVTNAQVQVAWLKEAVARPTSQFPAHALELRDLLSDIARNLKLHFPNIRLAFVSSRIYAGYATSNLNPEPYAYESGYSVKWMIERQIQGDPSLNWDPALGVVQAPLLLFGPYPWADGLNPRSDGLIWECTDYAADGTHPGPTARDKVADALDELFTTHPAATPWYVGTGAPRAAMVAYGTGCAGSNGTPRIAWNTLPVLGNAQFRIGVRDARPMADALLWISIARANLPLGGTCASLVDITHALSIPARIRAAGTSFFEFAISVDPALEGMSTFSQWWIVDPLGQGLPGIGVCVSDGVEARFGRS